MEFKCKSAWPFFVLLVWVCLLTSCTEERFLFFNRTSVKNAPADTPFVYKNTIVVEGDLSKDEKKRLSTELENYWDDSLRSRRQQRLFFYRIANPPVLDTANIPRTVSFMNGFLRSQGYYYALFRDSIRIDSLNNQQRASVIMYVNPGKPMIIDSFTYAIADTGLQKMAEQHKTESLIQAGKSVFSKDLISGELNRLVELYRNNGYFRLTREDLVAEADTMNQALLALSIDPLDQARQAAADSLNRPDHPTASLIIRLRMAGDGAIDPSHLRTYYNGNIIYYPETLVTELPDSLINDKSFKEVTNQEFTMRYREGDFVMRPLREHTYMRKGQLYNERNYYRTLNNLGVIGAWSQADAKPIVRQDSVDFHIFLVEAVPKNITLDVETSRNTGDFLSSNNLFGIAFNATYRNRNVWKRAIQSATSLRTGIDLSFNNGKTQIQTFQGSIGQSYSFPRLISPIRITGKKQLEGVRTVFNINASYADRTKFFRLRNLVTNWGYEWKKDNKAFQYRPINIELYSLDTLEGIREIFKQNNFLRYAFNTGSVVSQVFSFTTAYNDKNNNRHSNFIRVGVEESGALLGLIPSLRSRIYQYIKGEAEYSRLYNFSKTALALHAFAGLGYNFSKDPNIGNTLPFYKQFVAGGPNSMRAWGLRQLGLGSSLTSDTLSSNFRDRFGDMKLEANVEYRYHIAQISSLALGGAVFTDIGNIWNLRKNTSSPDGEFNPGRLGKDIAIGIGTGLRFDFNYFLIRVDMGIKLKDPARISNNGWLSIQDFTWTNKELNNSARRNNYAIQLGIGLPF
ncbi:MAG: surface antigen [Chitinophagaceae bacterium]|nr:surface antigen [Chitinophagaceae bacterium]